MGGVPFDPAVQAAQQAEILAQAVEQGVVTQAEADGFQTVHDAVEGYRAEHPEVVNSAGNATEREARDPHGGVGGGAGHHAGAGGFVQRYS
ncbi:MAG: hypothetical protein MZV64_59950 [Ignavibacteriales bacterium]|nr:hypothetical protein [Ignavibacteriales bacterium]